MNKSFLPDPALPLFPLQTVLFPDGLLELKIFEARYLDLMSRCLRERAPFGVVALRSGSEARSSAGEPVQLYEVGSSSRWRISGAASGAKRSARRSTNQTERCWPPVQPIATVR